MERILAYLTVGIAAISFVALFTVLLAPLFGVDFATSTSWVWPACVLIAYWGFPVAFVLLVIFVIWRVIANRRALKKQ
ncbi:hypothetical protein C7K25_11835 [Gulosibacter molinativorax]|uniref:Multidrug ABC transporter ATPase n=2 Tax=Gulosibacter molinativorax TaxID=256821 RepID=A0ABT7CA32_9MICO|nr:hypothetical protein [Gulosibacter molinativorax]QUY63901.1 Hypotetical protein [Gulosibacter molinativorax]